MFDFLKRLRWQKQVDGAVISPTSRDTFSYTDEQGRRLSVYAELQIGGSRMLYLESLEEWDEPTKKQLSRDEQAVVLRRVETFFKQNYVQFATAPPRRAK